MLSEWKEFRLVQILLLEECSVSNYGVGATISGILSSTSDKFTGKNWVNEAIEAVRAEMAQNAIDRATQGPRSWHYVDMGQSASAAKVKVLSALLKPVPVTTKAELETRAATIRAEHELALKNLTAAELDQALEEIWQKAVALDDDWWVLSVWAIYNAQMIPA